MEVQRKFKNFDAFSIILNVSPIKVGDWIRLEHRCIARKSNLILEPTGVLTFRRTVLDRKDYPQWQRSDERLPKLHLSSARKIEEFNGVTQVRSITVLLSLDYTSIFPHL